MNAALKRDVRSHNIGHSYLLLGEAAHCLQEARAFALALNCLDRQDGESCGRCRHCRPALAGNFGDLICVQPAGVFYKVAQIRALVRDAAMSSSDAAYRVFLLENADMMRDEGANALLKTLEEPPDGVVFLLCAARRDRILPTIESRCRTVLLPSAQTGGELSAKTAALLQEAMQGGYRDVFRISETLARDKEKTAVFFAEAADLLCAFYAQDQTENQAALRIPDAGADTILYLWERALRAPMLLEHQVNTRLVVDDFLLTARRIYGGNYGNSCRRTL